MGGRMNRGTKVERPIEKPDYPLPGSFFPNDRSDQQKYDRVTERAHFYRKSTGESGSPIYGFYITRESRGQENPGSKRQQDVS